MTKEHRLWLGIIALGAGIGMTMYYASATGVAHKTKNTDMFANALIGAGAAFLVTYAF